MHTERTHEIKRRKHICVQDTRAIVLCVLYMWRAHRSSASARYRIATLATRLRVYRRECARTDQRRVASRCDQSVQGIGSTIIHTKAGAQSRLSEPPGAPHSARWLGS
jgi:hypothetical protein